MSDSGEQIPTEFFDRADAIIHLANDQLNNESHGKVSASTLYAAARFNAFTIATSYSSAEEMQNDLSKIEDYFVEQYRKMLTENLRDYASNFAQYTDRT